MSNDERESHAKRAAALRARTARRGVRARWLAAVGALAALVVAAQIGLRLGTGPAVAPTEVTAHPSPPAPGPTAGVARVTTLAPAAPAASSPLLPTSTEHAAPAKPAGATTPLPTSAPTAPPAQTPPSGASPLPETPAATDLAIPQGIGAVTDVPVAEAPTPSPPDQPTESPPESPTVPPAVIAPARPAQFTEVVSVQTTRPVLALTFDAGGDLGATMQTLAILRRHGIHATFFVTGAFATSFPQAVAQMVADGHELGNHTYSHRDLTRLSEGEIQDELDRTDAILQRFSGRTTQPLMRMPYGSRDRRILADVAADGYRSIYWTLDAGDWRDDATAQGVTARVLDNAAAGDIVVQHCATEPTAEALETILDGLAARGLGIVTVSELLRDE